MLSGRIAEKQKTNNKEKVIQPLGVKKGAGQGEGPELALTPGVWLKASGDKSEI